MKEAIFKIKNAQKEADIVEIWLDYIDDLNFKKLLEVKKKPFLAVCKDKSECGLFKGANFEKIEILKKAIDCGFDFIDLGINTPEFLIKDLIKNKKKSKIIISYHNFEKTPSFSDLQIICKKGYSFGADIVKIATKANNPLDNLVIFNLIKKFKDDKKDIIALCMGEFGKLSRLFAGRLGSFLTFAPLSRKEASASGQIPLSVYKTLEKILFKG